MKWEDLLPYMVCEFSHYDICLTGLCRIDEEWFVCFLRANQYEIIPIDMQPCHHEFLTDYKKAYGHWCYTDGARRTSYKGQDLSWFAKKWERNPIMDTASVVISPDY